MNVIARDPIDNINTSRIVSEELFNNADFQPSALQRMQSAFQNSNVTTSSEDLLRKNGIANRGLMNSVLTSRAIFVPPMIKSNEEMMSVYRYPISGTTSNPNLSNERVAIGKMIMQNSQAVSSGRLY